MSKSSPGLFDRSSLPANKRKKETENILKLGGKVCLPSIRPETRVFSHLKNPKFENSAWIRKVWMQNYSGPKSIAVDLNLNTDIAVSENLFFHLLDEMGVPSERTGFSNESRTQRITNMGSLHTILSNISKGKHFIEYEEKKGEPDIVEIYSFSADIPDTSPIKLAVQQIETSTIRDPRTPYTQIVCDNVGLNFNPKHNYFNFHIKFYLKKPSDIKPEFASFHTGDHPNRSASLNIHVTWDRGYTKKYCCNTMDDFCNMINSRLTEFNKCFFGCEYLTLIALKDFEHYDERGRAVAYTTDYGKRKYCYQMQPLKNNKIPSRDKAPTETKEKKEVPNLEDEKAFPALGAR